MRSFQSLAEIDRRDTLTLQQWNETDDAYNDQIHGHEIIQESRCKQNEYPRQEGENRCYEGVAYLDVHGVLPMVLYNQGATR